MLDRLIPWKEPSVSFERGTEWAPEPFRTFWRRENLLPRTGIRTRERPVRSLVCVLTTDYTFQFGMQYPKQTVAGSSPRMPCFSHSIILVGFVVGRVTVGRFVSEKFVFSLPSSFHQFSMLMSTEQAQLAHFGPQKQVTYNHPTATGNLTF